MLADRTTVLAGFLVPIAAVGYITWTAFANLSTTAGGDHA
jgi:hypothetical protein